MKKLTALFLVIVVMLIVGNCAVAEENTFSLPFDIEFGMSEHTMKIRMSHIKGYIPNFDSIFLEGVFPEFPEVKWEMNFGTDESIVSNMKISYYYGDKLQSDVARLDVFEAMEEKLTQKYGTTEFARSGENYNDWIYREEEAFKMYTYVYNPIPEENRMTQRIVLCNQGGYVLITHVHAKYYGSWQSRLIYRYVGDLPGTYDNTRHEMDISVEDIY